MLEINDLKKTFENGSPALKGVNLKINKGEFVSILGPSGSGKTTLLRTINGLETSSGGEIYFDNKKIDNNNIPEIQKKTGMIFQEFNLINRMSVMDNLLSGRLGYIGNIRTLFKAYPRKDIDRAIELLERVGLIDHIDKRADELSGGQRQRVGIARALMQEPELLLLDEPTSSLDPKISREIMTLVKEMAFELRVPCLCNIHDVQLATEFCNKIVGIQEGTKMFEGDPKNLSEEKLNEIYAMEVL